MATRGSYVHISMGELSKIDGFEQKDSQGFENSYNSLIWTIPIRENFHFHHLPKLYFGFKVLIAAFGVRRGLR